MFFCCGIKLSRIQYITLYFCILLGNASGNGSNKGREFVVGFMTNWDASEGVPAQVALTTDSSGVVRVNVTVPLLSQIDFPPRMITLTYGQVETISFDPEIRLQGGSSKENKGIWITADKDITVYGYNLGEWSTDTFLALPVASLGYDHRVISVESSSNQGAPPSQMAVVAVRDETTVNISIPRLGKGTFIEYGGTYEEGEYIIVSLQKFETFQVQSHCDISGIRVESTKPIALYSGSNMAAIRGKTYDHMVEQLPSIDRLGNYYIVTPISGDSDEICIVKITATSKDTAVKLKYDTGDFYGVLLLAKDGMSEEMELEANKFLFISSNRPILVAQVTISHDKDDDISADNINTDDNNTTDLGGDPSMTLLPAINQYLSTYSFRPPHNGFEEDFHNFANIICRTEDENNIRANGVEISLSVDWIHINQTGISFTRLNVEPEDIILECEHCTFGVVFYGRMPYEAYANPGGISFTPTTEGDPSVLKDPLTFTIPPLKEEFSTENLNNTLNETSIWDELFSIDTKDKEKMAAGITVTVIVIVVLIAKVIFCMATLRSTNI